jgi:hypothetical protein
MSYTCPRCGMTSQNPEDERFGYCAVCHVPDRAWREMVVLGQEFHTHVPGDLREGKLHVKTDTGSEYVLDRAARTWTRIAEGERSGDVRTGGAGEYWGFAVTDRGLVILGPPVDTDLDFREIRTSPVSETWEEPVADEEPVEKLNRKLKGKHGFRGAAREGGAGENPGQDQGG